MAVLRFFGVSNTHRWCPAMTLRTHSVSLQVEHHLFPSTAHTHYPAIAPIVRATAAEFGLPYHVYPSFWAALSAHFRHLQKMGTASWVLDNLG
jgi:fatty acid desaturase